MLLHEEEIAKYEAYREHRRRLLTLQLVASLCLIGIGIALIERLLRDTNVASLLSGDLPGKFFLGGAALAILVGVLRLLLMYLNGEIEVPRWVSVLANTVVSLGVVAPIEYRQRFAPHDVASNEELERRLKNLELKSAEGRLPEGINIDEIVSELKEPIFEQVSSELPAKFAAEAVDASMLLSVRSVFDTSRTRLSSELGSLRVRANLNLAVGVLATLCAIALLVYMLPPADHHFGDGVALAAYYVPRIATAGFIEVFAFFFLKLYRATLGEMRTYQAELTQLDLARSAVESTWAIKERMPRSELAAEILKISPASSSLGKVDGMPVKELLSFLSKLTDGMSSKKP